MTTSEPLHLLFGWFYTGGHFDRAEVTFLPNTPATRADRLKALGFREAQALSRGRHLGINVYERDHAVRASLQGGDQLRGTEYAVTLYSTSGWEEGPIFAAGFPELLRLVSELEPFITVFDS